MRTEDQREILSVPEVNGLAKEVLESISFWVEGEIYDFKAEYTRGYYKYFQLKDEATGYTLPSIMVPERFALVDFDFDNGQKIIAHGKLTLMVKTGKYEFLADKVELAGEGQLAKDLEKLKAKLQAEGLLAEERKRPLPRFPQRIGVITSEVSDAWQDFQRHSVAKFPVMQLYLADAYVQGSRAVSSLLRAIRFMQTQPIEVLVITRGGGAQEDLAAFSDEQVVRAIAASQIPTLVAVGHEKDVSVADLVADVRASTPTNAGQILTKPYEEAQISLDHHHNRLADLAEDLVRQTFADLDHMLSGLERIRQKYQNLPLQLGQLALHLDRSRHQLLDGQTVLLAALHEKLGLGANFLFNQNKQRLNSSFTHLQAVSPLAILDRGYSIVHIHDKVVRSVNQVKQGDTMHIRLARGKVRGLVTRIDEGGE